MSLTSRVATNRQPVKGWLIAAGLGAGLLCHPTAGTAQSVRTVPAARSFQLGAMRVSVLHDGRLAIPNDGSVFATRAQTAEIGRLLSRAGQPKDRIALDIDVLLVRTKACVALIDAGYGTMGKSVLPESLRLAHVSPLEITDILITHAHPDHVGGLVDGAGKPAFPRATIHMSAREWRFMQHQADTRAIAAAVRSRVRTFKPGTWVVPGIRSRPLSGHTPGHVMYELVSRGERLLDIGDAAHSSVISLARPGWTVAWDSDQGLGASRRVYALGQLAESHERMFAGHFPFPGVGYVARKGNGFAFVPNVAPAAPKR